jgi:hypothetical protein
MYILFGRSTLEGVCYPRLREHLSAVIALMKASTTWNHFYPMIERALPRYDTTLLLPWDDAEN